MAEFRERTAGAAAGVVAGTSGVHIKYSISSMYEQDKNTKRAVRGPADWGGSQKVALDHTEGFVYTCITVCILYTAVVTYTSTSPPLPELSEVCAVYAVHVYKNLSPSVCDVCFLYIVNTSTLSGFKRV